MVCLPDQRRRYLEPVGEVGVMAATFLISNLLLLLEALSSSYYRTVIDL